MEIFTQTDTDFMQRALDLATLGKGYVSPNPLVGCVIVHAEKIIGEGWHKEYGGPHAEVNAINSINEKDRILIKESSVYVSLEPCAHVGKTPPCADLLIKSGVKKVFICNNDPNPLVNGLGIKKLRDANIEVRLGLLESKGLELNKRFFTFLIKKRPYIILKWAETADGFIARKDFSSKWISNELSRLMVHKMRAEESAVMVGTTTALVDNPSLTARDWHGRSPVRVVIDKNLHLPGNFILFDGMQATICYNFIKEEEANNLQFVKLNPQENFILQIVDDLFSRKIQSILVEGGAALLNSFVDEQLFDEIYIFKSKNSFDEGIKAPFPQGRLKEIKNMDGDQLFIYERGAM